MLITVAENGFSSCMKPRIKRIPNKPDMVMKGSRLVPIETLSEEERMELDNIIVSASEAMDEDVLVAKIAAIDKELDEINDYLIVNSSKPKHTKLEVFRLRLSVLKQHQDLLFKCLNKILPDKKSFTDESKSSDLGSTIDAITDEVLARIIAGTLSDDELEKIQLLFQTHEGTIQ